MVQSQNQNNCRKNMGQKINYQKVLEQELEKTARQEKTPRLLLHSCCAPCSSYVLEYLSEYMEITVFYYNPNIYPEQEYTLRVFEQQELIQKREWKYPISFIEGNYDTKKFYDMARGMEQISEGGERCFSCYEMRLEECARLAAQEKYDYFTTTLSISPMKNAQKLNEIGGRLAEKYGVNYLFSDFKKKNGYKRSVELSEEYGMYRQDYCGCVFSWEERRKAERERERVADIKKDDEKE